MQPLEYVVLPGYLYGLNLMDVLPILLFAVVITKTAYHKQLGDNRIG